MMLSRIFSPFALFPMLFKEFRVKFVILGVLDILDILEILDLWGSLFYIDFEGVDAVVVVESQDVHAALEGSW